MIITHKIYFVNPLWLILYNSKKSGNDHNGHRPLRCVIRTSAPAFLLPFYAARIIKLSKYLIKEKHENIFSKQIIRPATSIGANANEAIYGQSKADFVAKLHISLKETAES